jgi:hypothetical protein
MRYVTPAAPDVSASPPTLEGKSDAMREDSGKSGPLSTATDSGMLVHIMSTIAVMQERQTVAGRDLDEIKLSLREFSEQVRDSTWTAEERGAIRAIVAQEARHRTRLTAFIWPLQVAMISGVVIACVEIVIRHFG